jgi:hypothetical protein
MTISPQLPSVEACQIVLDLGKAINDQNYRTARLLLTDDMTYEGPFGMRVGADAYLEQIERLRLKFHIQRVFSDRDDICTIYNIDSAGLEVFACGLFHIADGKVNSLKVIFDPRPLLVSPKDAE